MATSDNTKGYSITDEDRQHFMRNKLDGFLCGVCKNVVKNATQTPCGHRYCKRCLDEKLKNQGVVVCNICNEPLSGNKLFRDKFADREVQTLILVCIYAAFGCKWKGRLHHREEHHKTCKFIPLNCTNPGCDQQLPKDNLTHHLQNECLYREVQCSYCEQPLIYKNVKEHENECPAVPVTCKNCGKKILRTMMKEHLNSSAADVCEFLTVPCPYVKVGCKDIVPQKHEERAIHLQTNLANHLNLLFEMIIKFMPIFEDLTPKKPNGKRAKLPAILQSVCNEALSEIDSVFKELKERIKQIEKKLTTSGDTPNRPGQYGNFEPELTRRLDNSDAKTADLEFLLHEAHDTIAEQRQELTRANVRLEKAEEIIRKLERRIEEQESLSGIRSLAVADLEERMNSCMNSSTNGILIWKIDQVARRRTEASSGRQISFYSPPFYSDPYGYKMCARIYLEGDGMGKGNHISLFFVVMRGEHDALLKWPFKQKVTMMLLDQDSEEHVIDAFRPDPTSSSFQRPKGAMNIASGCPMFCPHSELQRHAYICEDVMFIKVIVDRPDYEKNHLTEEFSSMLIKRFGKSFAKLW